MPAWARCGQFLCTLMGVALDGNSIAWLGEACRAALTASGTKTWSSLQSAATFRQRLLSSSALNSIPKPRSTLQPVNTFTATARACSRALAADRPPGDQTVSAPMCAVWYGPQKSAPALVLQKRLSSPATPQCCLLHDKALQSVHLAHLVTRLGQLGPQPAHAVGRGAEDSGAALYVLVEQPSEQQQQQQQQ